LIFFDEFDTIHSLYETGNPFFPQEKKRITPAYQYRFTAYIAGREKPSYARLLL
jgi:hypothetical protein